MITGGRTNNDGVYVYAAGVFDIIHWGHIKYLKSAKALGDFLIVGLLTDEGAERYKQLPILTYQERYSIVNTLKCVDMVVSQDDTDPTNTLIGLKNKGIYIDIMVRGDDYKDVPQGTEFINSNGGKVFRTKYSSDISSSEIKQRVVSRYNRNT